MTSVSHHRDVIRSLFTDMWDPTAVTLTCGPQSTVNVDRSTISSDWVSNGLWRARVGPVWAGPTRTRGMLWRCHVVAMGLHWASSTVRPALCGSWWIWRSRSMDRRHSLWWTVSTLLSPSSGSWWTERRAALPISPPFLCFPTAAYTPAASAR